MAGSSMSTRPPGPALGAPRGRRRLWGRHPVALSAHTNRTDVQRIPVLPWTCGRRGLGSAVRAGRVRPHELVTQAIVWWSDEDGGPSSRSTSTGVANRTPEMRRSANCGSIPPFQTNLRAMTWLEAQARSPPFRLASATPRRATSSAKPRRVCGCRHHRRRGVRRRRVHPVELIHGAAHRIPDGSAAFGGRRRSRM